MSGFVEKPYLRNAFCYIYNVQESSLRSPFQNPLIRFISDRKFRWLRHTLFIGLSFVLAFKGDIDVPESYRPANVTRALMVLDALLLVVVLAVLYTMIYVFVPKFLFRSKLMLFGLSFFFCICVIFFSAYLLDDWLLKPTQPANMQHIKLSIRNFVELGAVIAVLLAAVAGLKVFKKWIDDVQHINSLQEVNLKVELEQLKSQVNPHFLFNTLNNLYVLMKTDTDRASQVLLGLSDLLRYQLYDSTKENIQLSKDIEFIQNLLALEKIRKNDFLFTINTTGRIDGQMLPPFLFIPFVENAIKHGTSGAEPSELILHFSVSGGKLYFQSENSKPRVKQSVPGGLGLVNIRRRLELLYPGTHILEISDQPERFIVNLTIPL